jgi:hypothetical protein
MVETEHEGVSTATRLPEPAYPLDADEPLSPELALIDPEAAERARVALPDIALTESRIATRPAEQAAPRLAPLRDRNGARTAAAVQGTTYEEIRRAAREPVTPARRSRHRRRHWTLAVLLAGLGAGAALALPRTLDGQKSETPAERSTPTAKPALAAPVPRRTRSRPTKPAKPKIRHAVPQQRTGTSKRRTHAKSKPATRQAVQTQTHSQSQVSKPASNAAPAPKPRSASTARPVIPDFVWAPARHVTVYRVEFRSGSRLVLRVRTRAARLHVLRKQLRPGRYRWLVWGLNRAGSPVGKPLVDAKVRVR